MAEERNPQSSIMSPFLLNWNLDSIRAADKAVFGDEDSELSDNISLTSSMNVDMNPFESDSTTPFGKSKPQPGGFSVQYLLPLEVRCQLQRH